MFIYCRTPVAILLTYILSLLNTARIISCLNSENSRTNQKPTSHVISNKPTDWGQHSADYSHSQSGLECSAQSNRLTTASGASTTISLNFIACCKCYWSTPHTQEWSAWLLLSWCPWADSVLWCLHGNAFCRGCCGQLLHTSHHIWQCDTHNRGRTLWWMVNRLLVEYNLASLHCSWVCGHTASSSHVLTQLPPTVTSRASITFHVVHKPPVSTIKSSGTLHKHPTPHEYWRFPPLVWYNRQHWVSKRDHPKPKPHSNNPWVVWS